MVLPLVAAAGIGAAGSLASGMLNSAVNYGTSKKLMQKQYDLNMRQWREQNEYNLPVNMMKRYQDAGLNPHLVYGSGGASATAGTPSGVSQGHFNADFGLNALGDLANYQSILNQQANEHYTNVQATQAELTGKKQRELMDAQIGQIKASTGLTSENAFTQEFINTLPRLLTGNDTVYEGNNGIVERIGGAIGDWIGDAVYNTMHGGYINRPFVRGRHYSPSVWSKGALSAAGRLGRR